MDDVQAIRCLKRGDISGLETLVIRYQVQAIETAFLVTQDEAAAQDVVQDVFIHIYQGIQRFDEGRPFKPYLLRSVVHAALDAVEKRARWVPYASDQETEELGWMITRAASVENEVEFAQMIQEIQSALVKLPVRQRAVLVQRYYLDMSEKEMAVSMEAAPGTIKWLLYTARTRLRTLLGPERRSE